MKKLVVVLALAVCAVSASASSVSWSSLSAVANGSSGWRVWTFLDSDSSGSGNVIALSDAVEMIGTKGWETSLKTYNNKATTLGASSTFASSALSDSSWGNGVSVSGYAIIFDSSDKNLAGVTKYMVTDVQTVNFATSSDTKTFGLTPTGKWVSIGEDIPEPTSALLMLVGLAGLALRRRRA